MVQAVVVSGTSLNYESLYRMASKASGHHCFLGEVMNDCRCGHGNSVHDEGYCMEPGCRCQWFMFPAAKMLTNTLGEVVGSLEELLTRAASWEHEAIVHEKWGQFAKAAGIRKVADRIFNEALELESK